jgi:hypothetical protein
VKLLLITGSGASSRLNAPDDEPIVLMDGWARALRTRFGDPLSELIGLDKVETGEDFEELLGELTRWLQLKPLNMRFAWMTSGVDHGRDAYVANFEAALDFAEKRGARLEEALDETLYEQFGPARFDAEAPALAYRRLLRTVQTDRPRELICATTNYDRSLELALEALGVTPRTGFLFNPIRTPKLSTDGLGSFERTPSVLYLHGAVGWYRDPQDGGVLAYPAADPYRPDIGRPAVLYPSKNKVVEETTVAGIWEEFDRAIADASHILVLGHGLADDHLVQRLRSAKSPIAVTVHTKQDGERTSERLPQAHTVPMTFGPSPEFDTRAIAAWKDENHAS